MILENQLEQKNTWGFKSYINNLSLNPKGVDIMVDFKVIRFAVEEGTLCPPQHLKLGTMIINTSPETVCLTKMFSRWTWFFYGHISEMHPVDLYFLTRPFSTTPVSYILIKRPFP